MCAGLHDLLLGVGNIGATRTRRPSAAGHEVEVADQRGPETIGSALAHSGRAAHAADVVRGVDALSASLPLARIADIRPLDELPAGAVGHVQLLPVRDGDIAALDRGQVESLDPSGHELGVWAEA